MVNSAEGRSNPDDSSSVRIRAARNVSGALRLPGDKSISHRYAMLAAISNGKTVLQNFSTGADCASTLSCVAALGREVRRDGSNIEIEGRGRALEAPPVPLDCGNSGSTARMLSGILAGQSFETELTGDDSLSRRPMRRIIEPLRTMGATILDREGCLPLRVTGTRLRGIEYRLPVASAQVKSCLLFAGLFAEGETCVEEPLRTRDHGEIALRAFGAQVRRERLRCSISGGQTLHAIESTIPGDISTAAFFVCAAALFPESNLVFDDLLLNPTRAALLDAMAALGLRISMLQVEERHGELTGTVQVRGGDLKSLKLSGATTAALIDEIPVLAAIAPYTREGIEVQDARELRVKESDRIDAIVHNLRAMGAEVEAHESGFRVPGGQRLHGAELQSFGDHRIAMAFSIAALRAEGDTLMHGASAARISFPEFFNALDTVAER